MGLGKVITVAALFFLVGCGSNAVSGTDANDTSAKPPATLEEARQLWEESGVEDYEVTAQMTCYCPQELVQPIRLKVEGGAVVSSKGMKQPLENLTLEGAQRLTVQGLFQFIEEARRRDAHKLEVTYDAQYGFPIDIDYDGHPMIADDERQYQLLDFRASE